MNRLSKFQLWILIIGIFISVILIHGFIAIYPHSVTNGNTGAIILFESAINNNLIFPLIFAYIA